MLFVTCIELSEGREMVDVLVDPDCDVVKILIWVYHYFLR